LEDALRGGDTYPGGFEPAVGIGADDLISRRVDRLSDLLGPNPCTVDPVQSHG
jgi:hypothetical protein